MGATQRPLTMSRPDVKNINKDINRLLWVQWTRCLISAVVYTLEAARWLFVGCFWFGALIWHRHTHHNRLARFLIARVAHFSRGPVVIEPRSGLTVRGLSMPG
jgi:hypothetical protein